MNYSALDDRPGICEGCKSPDYPSQYGPSAKQISWNDVLRLWLCMDCRASWSNWVATDYATEAIRMAKKPNFLILWEKEHA